MKSLRIIHRMSLLLTILIFSQNVKIFAQEDIKKAVKVKITDFLKVEEFKNNVEKDKQPISSKYHVERLIELVNNRYGQRDDNTLGEIGEWINKNLSFTNNNLEFKDNIGILFLNHPLDVAKLKQEDLEKRKSLQEKAQKLAESINNLKRHYEDLEKISSKASNLLYAPLLAYDLETQSAQIDNYNKVLKVDTNPKSSQLPAITEGLIIGNAGTLSIESALKLLSSKDKKEYKKLETALSQTTDEISKLLKEKDKDQNDSVEILRNKAAELHKKLDVIISSNLQWDNLTQYVLNRKQQLEKELEEVTNSYLATFNQFVEKQGTNSLLLHQGRRPRKVEYSDYLLDTKEFLVVILGGEEDIANTKVTIKNKKSAFSTSAVNLLQLTKTLGISTNPAEVTLNLESQVDKGTKAEDIKVLEEPEADEIQVSFVLVRPEKVNPPSSITLSHESYEDITHEIHEVAYFQLRIGVSGANLDRKDFLLADDPVNDTQILTIQDPEDTRREEIKANAYALIEFYPGGRDLDRFDSFFKKGSKIPIQKRISITGGLRLTQDPLESIYTGLGFALDNGVSLTAGLSFQATPRDGTFPVGLDATLDYLRDNADRIYIPKFFVGISISPGAFSELIK
ncbi:hypothetical protein [Roseivirga sp. E12]|uniref:hypothetical protein n=1 Tax=Roseivirga sp. E12 TaxID=2819237 RepID=UPI001ABC1CCC|nr:hypothetical protein [Roseivirga sp. E12]MBO3697355.1 hypothetical protein [Roseivirga sp. E12]